MIAAGASVIRFTVACKIASASERNLRRISACNFANDITRAAHILHFCAPRDCVFAGNRFRSKFNYHGNARKWTNFLLRLTLKLEAS